MTAGGAALHITGEAPPAGLALEVMRADAAAGDDVVCLCIHDAVYWAVSRLGAGEPGGGVPGRLAVCADDCRRRALALPPQGAMEYEDIVDAIAAARRVTCW